MRFIAAGGGQAPHFMPPKHLATLGYRWTVQLEESNDRIPDLVKVGFSRVVFQQMLF